jgi:hypothetical protein
MRYNQSLSLLRQNLLNRFLAPTIALALLLTACAPISSGASPTSTGTNNDTGYLYTSPTNILFVQWTNTNGQISGRLQDTYTSPATPNQIQQINQTFTGTQAGSSINFTLSMFGVTRTIAGTLNGSTLTLVVPTPDGQTSTIQLTAATVAQYDNAVNALEAQIQGTATISTTETTTSPTGTPTPNVIQVPTLTGTPLPTNPIVQQQAIAAANNALGSALYRLQIDTNLLGSSLNLGGLFSNYEANWQQMQQYYQQEQVDANNGCIAYNAAKYADGGVNYYLAGIQSDDSTLSYIQQNINMNVTAIQQDMQLVQSAWQQLQDAVSAYTAGTPTASFSNQEVMQALQMAQNQVTSVQAQLKNAQTRATQYDNEANQLKQQADTLLNNMHCTSSTTP